MVARCHYPANGMYRLYGARGVVVCERWRQSFDAFLEDMGRAPSPKHSLDRLDNARGYEPGNVRWATDDEQARNRTDNVMLEFDGERLCMTDWAERIGVAKSTLHNRLEKGWSLERALTTRGRKVVAGCSSTTETGANDGNDVAVSP